MKPGNVPRLGGAIPPRLPGSSQLGTPCSQSNAHAVPHDALEASFLPGAPEFRGWKERLDVSKGVEPRLPVRFDTSEGGAGSMGGVVGI
jgi:hypothetical protein